MLPVLLLLLLGIHRNHEKRTLSLNQSIALGGVCSIYIMLGHVNLFIGIPDGWLRIIYAPGSASFLLNGLFFFISGYGLWKNRENKGIEYISIKGLVRRFLKLCLPAYILYIASYPILHRYEGLSVSFLPYIAGAGIIKWIRYNDVTWFLIELFYLYALFYMLFSNRDRELLKIGILITLILGWTIFAYLWRRGLVWYASTLCFPLGIILCKYEDSIKIHELGIWVLFIVVYSSFYFLRDKVSCLSLASNIASLSFCAGIYLLCTQHFVFQNKITAFLGKIRYELYLTHVILFKLSNNWVLSKNTRIVLCIVSSLIVAFLIHLFTNCVFTVVYRKNKDRF